MSIYHTPDWAELRDKAAEELPWQELYKKAKSIVWEDWQLDSIGKKLKWLHNPTKTSYNAPSSRLPWLIEELRKYV